MPRGLPGIGWRAENHKKTNRLPVVIHSPKPANLSLTGVNRITNRQGENMIPHNNNLAAQKFQGRGKVLWP